LLVHLTTGGEHDSIVALRGFAAHQLVQDVIAHPFGLALEGVTETTPAGHFHDQAIAAGHLLAPFGPQLGSRGEAHPSI
jgi:hypothetical protein